MNLHEEQRLKAIAQKRAESKEVIKISLSELVELITINRKEMHRGQKYTGVILVGELPQPGHPLESSELATEPFQELTLKREQENFSVNAFAAPCRDLGWIGVEKGDRNIWFYDNQVYQTA